MSSLFEYAKVIDEIIANNTDEDGVISEAVLDELNSMCLAKNEKVDNCISYIKSRRSMAEMLKAEKQAIDKRQKQAEKEAERVTQYLTLCLGGSKWESAAGQVSYRKSEAVIVDDEIAFEEFGEYAITKIEVKPDKNAIKDAIKAGAEIPGVHLEERQSTIIK